MLIRVEIPVDIPAIDNLLRHSFPTHAEADLVGHLREEGLLTLGMVAVDDEGQVMGYIGFTPVDIDGKDCQWVGLAPLAVAKEFQGQGIGRQLINEGLDSLNEFGYGAVVVLGSPDYYQKSGFVAAKTQGLHCKWPDTEDAFQIYALDNGSIEDIHGLVNYSPLFDQFS
ncbi:MAG TPA: GNAT family N-acetyltransferase [Proteus sp.]|uniref:GNAT family N-acetyltransferase n=1 Tax=Proteus hauseri TaxID=183417 RepID=UPI000EE9958B|nr:N-acetyltransferase [Proteus hauseri]QAV23392.1 GNAT family N-acetyltransferase [Proteus hauseri]HCH49898.1 GNAT family N-acetyltransferase [Proteus sp. (in: enterobacteria)]